MAETEYEPEAVFRQKMAPLTIFVLLIATPLYLLLLFLLEGELVIDASVVFGLLSLPLVSLAAGLIMSHLGRIEVMAEGVRGTDTFGVRRLVRWEEILTVKKWWYAGLPTIRVKTKPGSANLYLPDFFENRAELSRVVEEHAPLRG